MSDDRTYYCSYDAQLWSERHHRRLVIQASTAEEAATLLLEKAREELDERTSTLVEGERRIVSLKLRVDGPRDEEGA